MNVRRCAAGLLAVSIAAAWQPTAAPAAQTTNRLVRAVSFSREFIAYAANPLLPFAVCVFAERVNQGWREQLDLGPGWRDPIILVIEDGRNPSPRRPPLVVEVFATELHLKYQVTCQTPIEPGQLTTALVEALCAELANRDLPVVSGRPYRTAPNPFWLAQGLSRAIQGRDESLVQAARGSLAAGHPQTATEILRMKSLPDDPAERRLVEANCWLFFEGLRSLPQGAQKLQRCLAELGAQSSVTDAFWTAFRQDFPGETELEKWWALQLAERMHTVAVRNLTREETAVALDEILSTSLAVPTGGLTNRIEVGVRELEGFYAQPWMTAVLRDKMVRLQSLRSYAIASYRGVIDAYLESMVWLGGQKLNRFWRAVGNAEALRAAADRQARQISACLDRAERVYTPQDLANTFSNYFQIFEQFDAIQQQRHGPISDYLDKWDR